MPNSSEFGAGDVKVLKGQYNDLRDDVLDPTTGHPHTGGAGEGMQLSGPNAIVDRTRKFFVQGHGDGDIADNPSWQGYETRDGQTDSVRSWFMVPEDFVSGMTVETVVIPAASGNLYAYASCKYSADNELWDTHSNTFALATVAVVQNKREVIMSISLVDAAKNDLVGIEFTRTANGDDTIEDVVYVPGFVVSYTADS